MESERPQENNVISLDAFREKRAKEGREPRRKLDIGPEAEGTVTPITKVEDERFHKYLTDCLDFFDTASPEQIDAALNVAAPKLREAFFLPASASKKEIIDAMRQELAHEKKRRPHEDHD